MVSMSITSGRPRVPEAQRKGHRKYDLVKLPESGPAVEVPTLPDEIGMLKVTRVAWVQFWSSPTAKVMVPASDLPALVRLFHMADEFERCRREFRKQRIVLGSQDQPVLNPLAGHMIALAGKIQQLEDRFGASPVARLRLSIDLGEAQKSLDAMNARLAAGDQEGVEPDDDPRQRAIDI